MTKAFNIERLIPKLLIVLPILLIVALSIHMPSTFSVTVNSEFIHFKIVNEDTGVLPIDKAIRIDKKGDSLESFTGVVKLAKNAHVAIERIGYGAVTIKILNKNGNSVGNYYSTNDSTRQIAASDYLAFKIGGIDSRVNKGETIVIPITGEVFLGRNMNYNAYDHSTALLRHGIVEVIGQSIFTNSYYKSGTHDLTLGDEFVVERPKSKAFGFVTINENVGMSAAYKVIGMEGKIFSMGPESDNKGYPITQSLWSKLQNDLVIKSLSIAITLLFTLTALLPMIIKDSKKLDIKK